MSVCECVRACVCLCIDISMYNRHCPTWILLWSFQLFFFTGTYLHTYVCNTYVHTYVYIHVYVCTCI